MGASGKRGPDTVSTIRIPIDNLRTFSVRTLRAVGAPDASAVMVAEGLADADLRGVDTHGSRLLPDYVARVLAGGIIADAQPAIVSDTGSVVVMDANAGFGQVAGTQAMQIAVSRAETHGLAAVTVRNSNHLGALGYYARMATASGAAGFALSGGAAYIAPWGGADALLSTNPWSIAYPGGRHHPLVVDLSNGVVLTSQIADAADRLEPIPIGWALDAIGQPTEDPAQAKSLLAFGGQKGTMLTLVLEVLASILSGAAFSPDVADRNVVDRPQRLGHVFIVLQIDRFMPLNLFQQRIDDLMDSIAGSQPAVGHDTVRIPGHKGQRLQAERSLHGVPVPSDLAHKLDRLADDLAIDRPVV